MNETTNPIGFKKDDLVILPNHIVPNRRPIRRGGLTPPPAKVGVVLRVIDAEESPLGETSLMLQMRGGNNWQVPYGLPFIIGQDEVTRMRLHYGCETCTCSLPELDKHEPLEEEEDDEDEDL